MTTVLAFPSPPAALSFYDSACKALAEAKSLDEVKDIADKAMALKEYARRAKDRGMEIDAAELRISAERRLGEMLKTLNLKAGRPKRNPRDERGLGSDARPEEFVEGLPPVGAPKWNEPTKPTLDEIGVDYDLSARAQKLAALPERAFESRITEWRQDAESGAERVTARLLRDPPKRKQRRSEAALAALKRDWEKASSRERKAFLEWVKTSN